MNGTKSPTYKLNVLHGNGSGDFAAGQVVEIYAHAPVAGKVFDHWRGATFSSSFTNPTTLKMPSRNVTVEATYRPA